MRLVTSSSLLCAMSSCSKTELRRQIRGKLKGLDRAVLEAQSSSAISRLLETEEWKEARAIACYCSMPTELQTRDLLVAAFASHKRVFLPRVESISNRKMVVLEARSLEDVDEWPRSKWGIPEPPPSSDEGRLDALECDELDLVVVPGLAFDSSCRRLGQGAGFYDAWLSQLTRRRRRSDSKQPSPHLIAIALEDQILPSQLEIPTETHDVRLHAVISPSHSYYYSKN